MACRSLVKENHMVYMIDNKGEKVNLENDSEVSKYERSNKVKIVDIINEFLNDYDDTFNNIILEIEKLVQKYSIDYYMYGDGKGSSDRAIALIYNLKNRKSCIDCYLKVFYKFNGYIGEEKISYMIDFSDGSSGAKMGYSFYRYFNEKSMWEVLNLLEKYFSSEDDGLGDRAAIDTCVNNVKGYLNKYYS